MEGTPASLRARVANKVYHSSNQRNPIKHSTATTSFRATSLCDTERKLLSLLLVSNYPAGYPAEYPAPAG